MVSSIKLMSLLAVTIAQIAAATNTTSAPSGIGFTYTKTAACTAQGANMESCGTGGCYDPSIYCCYNGGLGQADDTIKSCPGYVAPAGVATIPTTKAATPAPSVGQSVVTPVIVNNQPQTPPAPVSQASGFQCGKGLNICTVYDPMTTSVPTPTCYDGHIYTCLQPSAAYKGQFLCPTSAPNLCGRACYNSANYSCLVNDTDVYNSQLLQVFTLGNVSYSTGLLSLPNNKYQMTFLPENGSKVNYVIVHYQSMSLDNGVQQNVFTNMTQSSSGLEYIVDVVVPSSQALVYSFTFQNTNGQQYDTGAVNFPAGLSGMLSSTAAPAATQAATVTPTSAGYVSPSSMGMVDVGAIQAAVAQYGPIAQAIASGATYTISYTNDCAKATVTAAVGSATINACNLVITQNGNTNTVTGTFTATVTDVFGPVINGGTFNAGSVPAVQGLTTPTKVAANSASRTVAAASLIGAAAMAMVL